MQANYTFVDSNFDKDDVGDSGFGFPGASKDNFNAVVYYDDTKLAVRLAYTYRSDYLNELAGGVAQSFNNRFTEAQSRLDAVVSYKFNENLSAFASLNNITEEDRRDFDVYKTSFRDYYTQRMQTTVGVKYQF